MAIAGKPGAAPEARKVAAVARQVALAMELPFAFVGSVVVGGLLGYGADYWLHTRPVGLLLGGALGFAAGIRELLRRIPRSGA